MSSVPELYGKRCRDLSPQRFPRTTACPRGAFLGEFVKLSKLRLHFCWLVWLLSECSLARVETQGALLISTYDGLQKRR